MSQPIDAVPPEGGGDGNQVRQEPSFAVARSLKRELLAELCASREEGRPLRPEDLLVRWPTAPEADPDVASLLFADYHQRRDQGETPDRSEYEQRFPEHQESLANLFSQEGLLCSLRGASAKPAARLALPAVGQEVFGFRLCRELGSGAFARVFLAEQDNLAGRPVVLKTSDLAGDEPQTLAQLQHTHIVPIHSVHEDAQAGLRAVCMPYFGGASLSQVLHALWSQTKLPTHGEELLEALAQVQAPTPHPRCGTVSRPCHGRETVAQQVETVAQRVAPTPGAVKRPEHEGQAAEVPRVAPETADQTPRTLLRKLSYPRAAAWIVARLAEGLQHAHDRGILHRDIKPSNILLSADAQPMLLDFNLSQNQQVDPAEATLGGTVAYMAPEHLRALNTRDPALAHQVDQRSDLYSLGMVLFEVLTGHNPFDQSGSYSPLPVMVEAMALERARAAPSVRQRRPDVPWSLESILRMCLAPRPEQRYQRAEHLAEDLRRFLDDRPLKYAPELSWRERAGKWLRRHPRVTSSGSVAAAAALLLLLAGTTLAGVRAHLAATREQLETAQSHERKRAYQEGTVRALLLVNANTDLQDHNRKGLAVCEQTLALYGILDREDWQEHPHWQRLDPEERLRLAEDTRELLLLLAWARVRLAPGDQAVLREALALLARAGAIDGLLPSPALWHDRMFYCRQLGEEAEAQAAEEQAKQLQPANARDHYLLATTYLRNGGADSCTRAIEELNRSVQLNPHYYWSWFQRGFCHQKAGDYHLAATDFGACIGLWPDFAWGYFNLGCAHDLSGRKEEAIQSYTAALERDPDFADASLNRGLAFLERKRYAEALADFTRAAAQRNDAALHAGRGLALEGLGRAREADEAFQEAFARLAAAPEAVQTRIRCGYGFAVCRRLPDQAHAAFEDVLDRAPRHPEALYGLALVAVQQGRAEEAIAFLDRAIAAAPHLMEARRHRAIQLARCGRFGEAFQGINWCLEREPQVSATLYAAACVAARAAERSRGTATGAAAAEKALALLQQAFAHGHGSEKAAQDPDLAGLQDLPEFRRLVGAPERMVQQKEKP